MNFDTLDLASALKVETLLNLDVELFNEVSNFNCFYFNESRQTYLLYLCQDKYLCFSVHNAC